MNDPALNHECGCAGPGECPKFKKRMSHRQWQICSGVCNPPCNELERLNYIRKWAREALPSIARQAINYSQAVTRHVLNHRTKVPLEVQEERLAICRECIHRVPDPEGYDREGRCSYTDAHGVGRCGCKLTHKTSWASEECPDRESRPDKAPKWGRWNNTMPRKIKWAYGVTTVPGRKDDLLPRTLNSLVAAGFDRPRLFIDGATYNDQVSYQAKFAHLDITTRYPRIRTYGNWILGIAELYVREPDADRYVMFQDDIVCYKNLRAYLEQTPFPPNGYFNLYTFMENEKAIEGQPTGWVESMPLLNGRDYHGKRQQGGRGAVALVFTRHAVLTLLTHQHIVVRPQDQHMGWRRVDGAIVETMNQAGFREYVHNPSLVQHTGDISSMGNRPHRKALSFRGEDFDALELLKEAPVAR